MSLQTESGLDLLTESGLPLLAEGESGGSDPLTVTLHGKVALALSLSGALTLTTTAVLLTARATLELHSAGNLNTFYRLIGTLTLTTNVQLGTIQPPPRLTVLTQNGALIAWFMGHPGTVHLSVQVDDQPEFSPALIWLNGATGPAIVKLDSPALPTDGLTHRITVRARNQHGDTTSAAATVALYAQSAPPPPSETPEWCGATLLRQGTQDLGDLIEIQWRHNGAVRIIVKLRKRNTTGQKFIWAEETLGYADYDEDTFRAENIGQRVWDSSPGQLHDVWLGVSALGGGGFGPVCWATSAVQVKERNGEPNWPGQSNINTEPDKQTKQSLTLEAIGYESMAFMNTQFEGTTLSDWTFVPTVHAKLINRIKTLIAQGGNVTINDLGRFEARWNADRTVRSVAFVPSAGFREGTRRGYSMRDSEVTP